MSATTPFWRFLPDGPAPDAESLRRAGVGGKGSLARLLREARHDLGSYRTAAMLRAARRTDDPFGKPFRLLVASSFQPRSILDALDVGLAIAGLSADLLPVDGLAALQAMLAEPPEASAKAIDLALVPVFASSPDVTERVLELAGRLTAHRRAPVLVAVIGGADETDFPARPPGVDIVPVAVDGPAMDERFAATFGLLPSGEAADRLADVTAGFAARLKGTAPKLVVTDLDGTLWAGTLGEDGAEALVLNGAYAEVLQGASRRGLILAIASRNDHADVEQAFAAHPEWPLGRKDFAALAVGWDAKDELVAACLDRLGLGAEHMIVVEDDAVNCARIAARFPKADVRHFSESEPDAFARSLGGDPLLRGVSDDAGERARQYRRREAVEHLRAEAADVGDFLRRLDTRLTVEPLCPALFPRAAELAARVNQFALTDFRPSAMQLAARHSSLDFLLRLDDAFGAHGLVGLVLAHREGNEAVLDNLLLSCRALGRGVEDAMLAILAERAAAEGCASLRAAAEPLPRNEPALRWFSRYATPPASRSLTAGLPSESFHTPQGISLSWQSATN